MSEETKSYRGGAAIDLPKWRCHKVVQAARIECFLLNGVSVNAAGAGSHTIAVELDHNTLSRIRSACWNGRSAPVEDLGYLVIYEDGYASWSPTQAFEQGYAPERSGPAEGGASYLAQENARLRARNEQLENFRVMAMAAFEAATDESKLGLGE